MTVIHGDCIEVMREMPNDSVDSIVTDPPYGLGFMGKAWDALPPGEDWARECLRVLKPGGHLLAFGGTRTWHRLAVAVEDAGFEIRDSIAWMYGSGFPKHRANLKPAHEPIVMARKPFKGALTLTESTHGTGALNIEGARTEAGRWPANVLLDEDMAGVLDRQTAELKGAASRTMRVDRSPFTTGLGELEKDTVYGDSGGASRFFKVAKSDERGAISEFFPREFDAPFMYAAKASTKERPVVEGVAHVTVKPLDLMRYLVRLVTPEAGTVLDPFAGSGTTLEAAMLEGYDCIGIEREAEYLPLIQARIDRQDAA